jgi:hypothetical protein
MSLLNQAGNSPGCAETVLEDVDCLPDMDFEFVDPGTLRGDGFELFRFSTLPPDISRGTVPDYDFRIRINNP